MNRQVVLFVINDTVARNRTELLGQYKPKVSCQGSSNQWNWD